MDGFIAITEMLVCNDLEVFNTENKVSSPLQQEKCCCGLYPANRHAVDNTPQTIILLMRTSCPPPSLPGPHLPPC